MLCQDGTSFDRQPHLVLCVRACVCACVYVCVWLSAKKAHLLAYFVKMAHLWTDNHTLCCVCVRVRACVCVYVCRCMRVCVHVCVPTYMYLHLCVAER